MAPPLVPMKMNLRSRKRKCQQNQNPVANKTMVTTVTTAPRYSTQRYNAAEEKMVKVMKDLDAKIGNPILRTSLREEARRLIADTGLLDNLLAHMGGTVAPGGTLRFGRRCNANGATEYWLEDANLANIRRQAGIQDAYWTPPPGWSPGDNPTQDPTCAKQIKQLKEQVALLRSDMEREKIRLGSKKPEQNTKSTVLKLKENDSHAHVVPYSSSPPVKPVAERSPVKADTLSELWRSLKLRN